MNYIDGFVFPISKSQIVQYQKVAEKVAVIWKEYGALSYQEFVGDEMTHDGTQSFESSLNIEADEVVIFGFVVFPSKEVREQAIQKVPIDTRMTEILAPLMSADNVVFDAERMLYGGFKPLFNG